MTSWRTRPTREEVAAAMLDIEPYEETDWPNEQSGVPSVEQILECEVRALHKVIEHFAAEVEAARSHHENKGKGGMRVPFHGDFGQCPPSVMNRLAWHVRNMKGSE